MYDYTELCSGPLKVCGGAACMSTPAGSGYLHVISSKLH